MRGQRTPEELREAQLDQLAWIAEEMNAFGMLAAAYPPAVFEMQPGPDELSIKQIYGVIALLDEQVYLAGIRRMVEQEEATLEAVDVKQLGLSEQWEGMNLSAVLARARAARSTLHAYLSELPLEAWQESGGNLFKVVGEIIHTNTDLLREVGQRLYAGPTGR